MQDLDLGDGIRFVGYAFVDETNICHCQTGQDEFATGEEAATQMQGPMDAWEGGMRATGATRRRRNLTFRSMFGI
jgi:hypothetical protein